MKKILCLAFLLFLGTSAFGQPVPVPGGTPDYFGIYPNYANSPLPVVTGYNPVTGAPIVQAGTGMRKFVDPLPGLYVSGVSPAPAPGTKYIPVAVPDTTTYPGDATNPGGYDYYEIELGEYTQKMHSDLPPTKLRGYRQTNTTDSYVSVFSYLGPVIIAQRDRPVRIKFTNNLPTGAGGNLFIPVDTTYMGAGTGPNLGTEMYTQNRGTLHLHGGTTPWISDGTLFQWTTPAGETTSYPKGVSVYNVPDMPNPGEPPAPPATDPSAGVLTFFYSNQQSARLMFYHDHAVGITRLNVYAGEAAGYLVADPAEQTLFGPTGAFAALGEGIPLVIQDKTFVPDNTRPFTNFWGTFPSQLAAQDPTWDTAKWGGFGQLWFPHVYMTNQNPWDITGTNAMGRWDYGPWFWPPFTGLLYGPVANPYAAYPGEPPQIPGVPSVSGVPEAFMDTMVVNGTAYPTLTLDPKPYRFRILSVGNDRMLNLSLWVASPIVGGIRVTSGGSGYTTPPAVTITNAPGDTVGKGATATATIDTTPGSPTFGQVTGITLSCVGSGYTLAPIVTIGSPPIGGTQATAKATLYTSPTEVGMVPFSSAQNAASPFPSWWYTVVKNGFTFDDRAGGVPDPATRGPAMIQIATEGGFLPAPVVVKNQPVNYVYNRRDITVGNIKEKALFLGPAERADIIVDFTNFAGKTLVLYNDSPAPVPAADPRLDYYTGDPDQTDTGGAPSTLPGYGPNTRTVMQILVTTNGGTSTAPPDDYNPVILGALQTAIPSAFAASQDSIIVPQQAYDKIYGTTTTDTPGVNLSQIQSTSLTFAPLGQTTPVLFDFYPKSIIENFQFDYGRMNALLGIEIPNTNIINQTSIIQALVDPPTEVVKISDPSLTPIGTAADGTQIWKITHNGVDTHAIHFHMFTVQVINRVGWDGAIRPPDPNELGFKDTVRMNPLEDIIVALRPIKLTNVPFKIPNSIRPLAPDAPIGAVNGPTGAALFNNVDPQGLPITITNQLVNYGWEYVWHCHILGHEENDMMRPMALAAPPDAPSGLAAILNGAVADLTWTDNSLNETSWTVQRATNGGAFTNLTTFASTTGPTSGTQVTYTDPSVVLTNFYTYQVIASNTVGSTVPGYPQVTADSAWSNIASVGTPTVPGAPTGVTATAGNAQATVSFTAPADGGSPITLYTVTSSPGGITATGAASPITVTALTNGTAYTFTVTATNAIGTGPASNPSNSVTPATAPGAPTGATATAGNAQATVSFTPPASNGGSVITSYRVTSSPGGITATGAASPITVTALTNGTAYTFTVTATNAIGTGPASAPSNQVTPVSPTPPAAPTNLIFVTSTVNSITISWKDNATTEQGFYVQRKVGTSWNRVATLSANTTTYTDPGLSRGTRYQYRVQAYNAAGISTYSNTASGSTKKR